MSDYVSDEDLSRHINALSRKDDHVSREELIQIADYIQTEIVAKGETYKHIALVNADEKKDIELAPYFYSLWGLTQKSTLLLEQSVLTYATHLRIIKTKAYSEEDNLKLQSIYDSLSEASLKDVDKAVVDSIEILK